MRNDVHLPKMDALQCIHELITAYIYINYGAFKMVEHCSRWLWIGNAPSVKIMEFLMRHTSVGFNHVTSLASLSRSSSWDMKVMTIIRVIASSTRISSSSSWKNTLCHEKTVPYRIYVLGLCAKAVFCLNCRTYTTEAFKQSEDGLNMENDNAVEGLTNLQLHTSLFILGLWRRLVCWHQPHS